MCVCVCVRLIAAVLCVSSCDRLDAPTRALFMDAPDEVRVKALSGHFSATSKMDVLLRSNEGLVGSDVVQSVYMTKLCVHSNPF